MIKCWNCGMELEEAPVLVTNESLRNAYNLGYERGTKEAENKV